MNQQLLSESKEKKQQPVESRETSPDSTSSFQRGLHPITQLQQTLGNRQVAKLIQAKRLTPEGKIIGLQRKLTVGAADDQYEQEADRVANQVMTMPDAEVAAAQQNPLLSGQKDQSLQTKPLAASITPVAQRQTEKEHEVEEDQDTEEEKDRLLQAKPSAASVAPSLKQDISAEEEDAEPIQLKTDQSLSGSFDAGNDIETQLNLSKGRGSPLPDPVRSFMEPRFGVDFSQVRTHTGSDANQMNRDVGAQAFTHGADIYYGEDRNPSNLELTAHELTHVVQQTGGAPLKAKRSDETPSTHANKEAEENFYLQRVCEACTIEDSEEKGDDTISPAGTTMLARLKTAGMAPDPLQRKKTTPEKSEAPAENPPAKPAASPQTQAGIPPTSAKDSEKPTATHPKKPEARAPEPGSAEIEGPQVREGVPEEAAPSPSEAIGPAVAAVRNRATKARKHSAPDVPVASAQAAAKESQTEQTRAAAAQTVTNLNDVADQTKNVEREDFRQKLKDAIHQATPQPKTEEEAEEVMESGATKARSAMHGHMDEEQDAAAGPLKDTGNTEVSPSNMEAPPQTTLRPETVGAPPASVSASPVVPADLPPERLDYSADREPADKLMAENNISKEQLKKGNEPAFDATLTARSSAEKHEATAKVRYRESEAGIQDKAQGVAKATLANDLLGMQGDREQRIGKIVEKQAETKSKNALERQRITDTIKGIKEKTKADVDAILESMESGAETIFEAGLAKAEKAYSETFEEEKGGIGTWLTTWGEDWEELIEGALDKARIKYLQQVDVAIDKVADHVDAKLAAAKKRVAEGRKEVENFVNGLDKSVAKFGEEALRAVSDDFDTMEAGIDERRDKLIDKLTDQYKASYERMSAMEEKLREENKSLWQRVYDATIGIVEKILAFKDMLLGILKKAAGVIGDIIEDPIGFLGNLISGIAQGLENFMARIGAHLKKGLMDWLFGALGGAGLQLPETLDLKGIISIVLQVLGLTYANFRARAVAIVGEGAVSMLEKTAEVFKVLITEGISGLWRFIKEKVGDLKAMVLDAIFDFIKDSVIIAGIKWVIGLLNPASAFFKACMAIYDIVMFFINRGSQIIDLVNAIVDSIASIAKGALGTAAKLVESALAKAIPVTIGFLAGLLGLGDISGTVRNTIDKAKSPVDKAIDWVINMAVKGLKKVGGLLGFGEKDAKSPEAKQKGGDEEVGKTVNFSAAGKSHRLWINVQGASAKVMMASSTEEVAAKLDDWQGKLETVPEERRAEAQRLLAAARQALGNTQGDAQEAVQEKEQAKREPSNPQAGQEFAQADEETEAAEQSLADILRQLYEIFGEKEGREDGGYEHVPKPSFETEGDAVDHAGRNRNGFKDGLRPNIKWESTGQSEYIDGPIRRGFFETGLGRVRIEEWWCDKEGNQKRYRWKDVVIENAQTHKESLTEIGEQMREERERKGAERRRRREREESDEGRRGRGERRKGRDKGGSDTDE